MISKALLPQKRIADEPKNPKEFQSVLTGGSLLFHCTCNWKHPLVALEQGLGDLDTTSEHAGNAATPALLVSDTYSLTKGGFADGPFKGPIG